MVTKRGRSGRRAEELAVALRQYWKDHPHSWDNLLADEATVDAVRGGDGQLGISIGCTSPVCDQADQGDETDSPVLPDVPGAKKHASHDGVVLK